MKFNSVTVKLRDLLTTKITIIMPDFIDRSVVEQELLLSAQLANAKVLTKKLEPKEACHNCAEPLLFVPNQLFCDRDCADDYEKYPREA